MEYCGGGSVADLMHASDVPLDQDMISYICAETLAGLAYLHSIGKACAPSAFPLAPPAACMTVRCCCAPKIGLEFGALACFCCL